jgi:autotransporter translocation and assembly factor TamB
MRPGRRVLAGIGVAVLALVLLAGGFVLYLTTGPGERLLARVLTSQINTRIAGQIALTELDFDGRVVVLHDVSLHAPDGERVAWARRVRIEPALGALLRGRLVFKRVTASTYDVTLRHRDGRWNLLAAIEVIDPVPEPRAVTIEELALSNGRLDVRLGSDGAPGVRAHHVAVSGRIDRHDALDAALRAHGRAVEPGSGDVAIEFLAAGRDQRQHLEIAAELGAARVAGSLALPAGEPFDLGTITTALDVRVPEVEGHGHAYGPIELAARLDRGRFELARAHVVWPGLSVRQTTPAGPDGVGLALAIDDLADAFAAIAPLVGRELPEATLRARMGVTVEQPPTGPAQAVVLDAKIEEVAAGGTVVEDAAFVARLTRAPGEPLPAVVRVGELALTYAGTRWASTQPAIVRFRDLGVEVEALALHADDQHLAVDGAWTAHSQRIAASFARVRIEALPEAVRPGSVEIGGRLDGYLQLVATAPLRGRASLVATEWHVEGVRGKRAALAAHLEEGRASGRFSATALGGTVQATFDVPIERDTDPIDVTVALDALQLSEVWRAIAAYVPEAIATRIRSVTGRLDGSARIGGTVESPEPTGSIAVRGGTVAVRGARERYRAITLDADVTPDRVNLRRLDARAGDGRLAIQGRATRAGDAFRYRLDVELDELALPAGPDREASVAATVAGTISRREVTTNITFSRLRIAR